MMKHFFYQKIVVVILIIIGATISLNAQKIDYKNPNVVFIISDQHKKKASGCYGSDMAITPNIDKLAATGIKLNNCYAAAPVCAPSRAALTTGMYPEACGAPFHKAPVLNKKGKMKDYGSGELRKTSYHEGIVTLGEIFRNNGYVTAGIGKMHVHGELQKNVDPSFPKGNDMGFDEASVRYYTNFPGGHYEDEVGRDTYERYRVFGAYNSYRKDLKWNSDYKPSLVKNDEDNFDMVVTQKSIKFIKERGKDEKNFFLHVGLEKPHPALTTTQKYLDMFDPKDFELPETSDDSHKKGKYPWVPNWSNSSLSQQPEKAKNVMAAYHASVSEMDAMVGRIVQSLKENNLYENTIIIYTTDHGEHLFEHGFTGKHNMYEAAVNIPFIISYPKLLPTNKSNNSLVSLIDVMPTLCDLMGWEVPETAQGRSIVKYLKSGTVSTNRSVFSEFRGSINGFRDIKNLPSRMMRLGDYKLVYTHGVINQLYNVTEDPNEMNNLVLDKNYQEMQRDLCFQTLAEWRPQEYNALKITRNSDIISWDSFEGVKNYVLYFAETNTPIEAKLIATEIEGTSYKVTKNGYYWVMAIPQLTRTTKRLGDIPVYMADYTMKLPVSDVINMNKEI
jgi:iduronate 2-sulfatase